MTHNEKEKLDLFKQHKLEVKSWLNELGEMTKKHIKLEKKFHNFKAEKEDMNNFNLDAVQLDAVLCEN